MAPTYTDRMAVEGEDPELDTNRDEDGDEQPDEESDDNKETE